jgi:hypothetical protein
MKAPKTKKLRTARVTMTRTHDSDVSFLIFQRTSPVLFYSSVTGGA